MLVPSRGRCCRCLPFVLALCFVVGCVAASSALAVEHVVHVSIDGLPSHYLQEAIDAGRAPTLKRLQDEGAWTANARTDFTHTVTLPNHTSMLTGRPVLQPAGMPASVHHGWTDNDVPPRGATLHNTGNPAAPYIASVFDVAHDAGLSTAMFASKDKFEIYDHSYNETAGADGPHGRRKIDLYVFHDDGPPTYSAEMNRQFIAEMVKRHFNYSFVHYRDTDSAGHAHGWGSPTYKRAIATVDSYLADVLALVETDPALTGKTAIIVSTDHGGIETNHGENERPENYTIPVLVWGAGVGCGNLYAMNAPSRADPGDGRTDYNAPEQPIRNGDTGNLALKLLGLGPIPGSIINAKQDLRVTRPGDYNRDGTVDAADFTPWRNTLGSTTELAADGNDDGVVDQADYEVWKAAMSK